MVRVFESLLMVGRVLKQLSHAVLNNREVHNAPRHIPSISHMAQFVLQNIVEQSSTLDLYSVDGNSKSFRPVRMESSLRGCYVFIRFQD